MDVNRTRHRVSVRVCVILALLPVLSCTSREHAAQRPRVEPGDGDTSVQVPGAQPSSNDGETVLVATTPTGADLYLDGDYLGQSPLNVPRNGLTRGGLLTAFKAGHAWAGTSIEGAEQSLALSLEELRGVEPGRATALVQEAVPGTRMNSGHLTIGPFANLKDFSPSPDGRWVAMLYSVGVSEDEDWTGTVIADTETGDLWLGLIAPVAGSGVVGGRVLDPFKPILMGWHTHNRLLVLTALPASKDDETAGAGLALVELDPAARTARNVAWIPYFTDGGHIGHFNDPWLGDDSMVVVATRTRIHRTNTGDASSVLLKRGSFLAVTTGVPTVRPSNTGRKALVLGDATEPVALIDIASGNEHTITPNCGQLSACYPPMPSPDDQHFAWVVAEPEGPYQVLPGLFTEVLLGNAVYVLDDQGRRTARIVLPDDALIPVDVAWSPDGHQLLIHAATAETDPTEDTVGWRLLPGAYYIADLNGNVERVWDAGGDAYEVHWLLPNLIALESQSPTPDSSHWLLTVRPHTPSDTVAVPFGVIHVPGSPDLTPTADGDLVGWGTDGRLYLLRASTLSAHALGPPAAGAVTTPSRVAGQRVFARSWTEPGREQYVEVRRLP